MSRAKNIVALVVAVLAAGLGYRLVLHTPSEFSQADVAAFESDATESLVRNFLKHAGTNQASVCFLAFGHRLTPPTDRFLGRFVGSEPPIKGLQAHKVSLTGEIIEAASGRAGVIIQVAKMQKRSEGEMEFEVALSNLPAGGNRFICTMVRRDGQWRVATRKPYE